MIVVGTRDGRLAHGYTAFRGNRDDLGTYFQHIRRIADHHNGMVLLLTDQDVKVFLRQAIKGKVKEDHIRERYDTIVRGIS